MLLSLALSEQNLLIQLLCCSKAKAHAISTTPGSTAGLIEHPRALLVDADRYIASVSYAVNRRRRVSTLPCPILQLTYVRRLS